MMSLQYKIMDSVKTKWKYTETVMCFHVPYFTVFCIKELASYAYVPPWLKHTHTPTCHEHIHTHRAKFSLILVRIKFSRQL